MRIEGKLMRSENAKNIIEETLKSLPKDALISFIIESKEDDVEDIHKKLDDMIEKETNKLASNDKVVANRVWLNKLQSYCDSVQCSCCNFFDECTKVQNIAVTTEAPCFFTKEDDDALLEASKEYLLEEEVGKIPEIGEEYY